MSQSLRVGIVGGGIGGLAAAVALQRLAGVEVVVYEQASALGEVGAGVGIAPNGARMFDHLGLRDPLERVGAPYRDGSAYYRYDGEPIGDMTTSDSAGEYFTMGLHRADLVELLVEALAPGAVRTGHALRGLEEVADGVRLDFRDGSTDHVDAVIGADGIHSVVRSVVTEPAHPVSSGSIAYRGIVDMDRLPGWTPGIAQLWMGEGKHFLTYPVRAGRLLNYVGFVPSDERVKESWSAAGDPVALARDFAGWDPRVESVLGAVERTFWWGLYDREPLSQWSRGRVTLLGDAAHPMLPHLGQGANQAVEDGVTLALLLRGVDRDGVVDALSTYERLRLERTAAVQRGARDNGRRYDSAYEDLGQRDGEIKNSRDFRLWLYDYDARSAAAALAR